MKPSPALKKTMEAFHALAEAEADPVIRLCKLLGYGRVMQIASEAWRDIDPVGAHSTGHCFGTLERAKKHGKCAYCEQKLPKKARR